MSTETETLMRGYKLQLLRADNPKKSGSATFQRYALYRDGMTLGELAAAVAELEGKPEPRAFAQVLVDMRWDADRGFVLVHSLKVHAEQLAAAKSAEDRKRIAGYAPGGAAPAATVPEGLAS